MMTTREVRKIEQDLRSRSQVARSRPSGNWDGPLGKFRVRRDPGSRLLPELSEGASEGANRRYHAAMKTHLLLIGFSCTGKTSLGQEAFGEDTVLDSDDELRKWIGNKEGLYFDHVYEIYMKLGRDRALPLIEEAEKALVDRWADDTSPMIIGLGPGFPFRDNWVRFRAISHVVLFKRSPHDIYKSMKKRRNAIFGSCPEAKKHDNWDVGVIGDEYRREFSQKVRSGISSNSSTRGRGITKTTILR